MPTLNINITPASGGSNTTQIQDTVTEQSSQVKNAVSDVQTSVDQLKQTASQSNISLRERLPEQLHELGGLKVVVLNPQPEDRARDSSLVKIDESISKVNTSVNELGEELSAKVNEVAENVTQAGELVKSSVDQATQSIEQAGDQVAQSIDQTTASVDLVKLSVDQVNESVQTVADRMPEQLHPDGGMKVHLTNPNQNGPTEETLTKVNVNLLAILEQLRNDVFIQSELWESTDGVFYRIERTTSQNDGSISTDITRLSDNTLVSSIPSGAVPVAGNSERLVEHIRYRAKVTNVQKGYTIGDNLIQSLIISVLGSGSVSGSFWYNLSSSQALSQPVQSELEAIGTDLGQKPMAQSRPVTIASDQSPIPVKQSGDFYIKQLVNLLVEQASAWVVQQGGEWNVNAKQLGDYLVKQAGAWIVQSQQSGEWIVKAVQSGPWGVDAKQSGPWTMNPGNSANTTPWLFRKPYSKCSQTIGAATTNAKLIQTGARVVTGIAVFNFSTSNRFLKLFNKAEIPVVGAGGDTPVLTVPIPANTSIGGAIIPIDSPIDEFPLGLGMAITQGIASNDGSALSSPNDVLVLVFHQAA